MAFVKVNRAERQKMYKEGGYREREIMKNAKYTTTALGSKECVKFHGKDGRTAIYRKGRGWVG